MTDAYTLTPARAADADALHDLLCVPEVYRYLADGAPPPRAVTEQWLARSAADFESHGVGLWLLRAGQDLAGCVLLEVLEDTQAFPGEVPRPDIGGSPSGNAQHKSQAELTYVLHPDHWGKGLATRMAWTVMQQAFENGLAAVIAGADGPNTASLAVMKRLGMRFYRTVQYPAGEGTEYILRNSDPPLDVPLAVLPLV